VASVIGGKRYVLEDGRLRANGAPAAGDKTAPKAAQAGGGA
jgi:hypothetical protein